MKRAHISSRLALVNTREKILNMVRAMSIGFVLSHDVERGARLDDQSKAQGYQVCRNLCDRNSKFMCNI